MNMVCNVGFLSVCCEYVLLSLVNKEADLAKSQAENPSKDIEKKESQGLGDASSHWRSMMSW